MRILQIKHNPYCDNKKINFGHNKTFFIEEKNGIKCYIDNSIKDMFTNQKDTIINNTTQKTSEKIESNWINCIDNIQRYKSALNKTEIFTKLAQSLHSAQKFELAATTLALALNNAEKNIKFESDEKKYNSLINKTQNLEILKDFFATSRNNQTKFYVMNALKEYKSPYFLPVAEDVLEFDNDTVIYCDKKTTNVAREYLHNFYNFNLLRKTATKSNVHQNAALNIISKWGTANDKIVVEKIKEKATNNQIKAKCEQIEEKLKNLDKIQNFTKDEKEIQALKIRKNYKDFDTILNEIFDKSNQNALVEIKQYKYPHGSYNASKIIEKLSMSCNTPFESELIKLIGQTSTFINHMEFVKPEDNNTSQLNTEKAEAYYKIMMRSNFDK